MTTSKTNAVHKADVKVGSTYAVKVSGRIVPVTIQERKVEEGDFRRAKRVMWKGMNHQTGKTVYVRSAAKLRYELARGWLGSLEQGNWRQGWVRKDSPIVFALLEDDGTVMYLEDGIDPTSRIRDSYLDAGRILRDVTPDELRSLCGEDAPEQCQEFEDESGRWRRV